MKQEMTLHQAVGQALSFIRSSQLEKAARILDALPPDDAVITLAKARLIYAQGDNQRAFDMVRPLTPVHSEAIAFLCYLWAKSGDVKKTASYMKLLEQHPVNTADFWGNLGVVFYKGQNYPAAISCCNRALELDEACEEIWLTLGAALRDNGRPDQAIPAYFRALALNPHRGETYLYLHVFFYECGDFDKAIHFFNIAKASGIDNPQLDLGEAHCLLKQGKLQEGFQKYRARYARTSVSTTKPQNDAPVWQGEALSGKSLLVYCEQGFGDVIQFSRFLSLLQGQGADITFVCRKPLLRLMVQSFPAIKIVEQLEGDPKFDYQSYLIDLAIYLDISPENMPLQGQYLSTASNSITLPKNRKAKIGFVWHGGTAHLRDHLRSLTLGQFITLLKLKQFDWYNLQIKPNQAIPMASYVIDKTKNFTDFADTAALVDQLDLVITVDTATAHLAAALGKPVWIMLDQCADWRWLESGETSYWYESVKLYRQSSFGDWDGVLSRIKSDLLAHFPD